MTDTEKQAALDAYWAAKTRDEERAAVARMKELGMWAEDQAQNHGKGERQMTDAEKKTMIEQSAISAHEIRREKTAPPLGKIISWTAAQNDDGTGEMTIQLSDGGRVRQWCDYLAGMWVGEER